MKNGLDHYFDHWRRGRLAREHRHEDERSDGTDRQRAGRIVGSFLGSWAAIGLGVAPAGSIMSFLVALAGAIALIFILRALGIFKKG